MDRVHFLVEAGMPLVHIAMRAGKPAAYRQAILDSVYRAMREALSVPEDDQFMFITEHEAANFRYGKTYLGIDRSDALIYVRFTVFDTRSLEQKQALFRRLTELLGAQPGIRAEDIFVNLVEASKENWSLGHGLAQFAASPS